MFSPVNHGNWCWRPTPLHGDDLWRMKMTLPSSPNKGALVVCFAVGCVMLNILPAARAADSPKPNVIVILTDDQGSVDAGCYGAKDLVTPGVDSLAAHGVRFTQFYSAAPVCSPSRAALLTGRYPWLAGMPNNAAAPPTEADDQLDTLAGEGLRRAQAALASKKPRERKPPRRISTRLTHPHANSASTQPS